jgi:hypothetical protein
MFQLTHPGLRPPHGGDHVGARAMKFPSWEGWIPSRHSVTEDGVGSSVNRFRMHRDYLNFGQLPLPFFGPLTDGAPGISVHNQEIKPALLDGCLLSAFFA